MKTVSLKINEDIFGETEKILSKMSISRNKYINDALDYYNRVQKRKSLELRLKIESNLVKEGSMSVLHDFEKIEDAD